MHGIKREGTLTLPNDRTILMQRVFEAPARVLFDVWTKPEHVRKWYAVRSTTMTVCDIDLRVGGAWRWVIVTPTGMEVAFSGVFTEIDPPRRLQRTEVFEAMPGPGALVTISFDERDGQTTLSMEMVFDSKEERDLCLKSGMELGVQECYQKIDELVAAL
ncbi:SRPBCC family protein [Paludibaculum fermentans]|uniref:SRPBCC family protein n=1 Tax=Paludibaculum fermentans TaxID=1473598 RepID=UPI003EBCF904